MYMHYRAYMVRVKFGIARAMATAYLTTVVGVLSHASWVMATIDG